LRAHQERRDDVDGGHLGMIASPLELSDAEATPSADLNVVWVDASLAHVIALVEHNRERHDRSCRLVSRRTLAARERLRITKQKIAEIAVLMECSRATSASR
jgi:hypothetical protein